MSVKVLKTDDTWYGMTYHEDVAAVKDSFKKMLENGLYKADLFADFDILGAVAPYVAQIFTHLYAVSSRQRSIMIGEDVKKDKKVKEI